MLVDALVKLGGLGVSVVDTAREELVFATVGAASVSLSTSAEALRVRASVSSLQIDNASMHGPRTALVSPSDPGGGRQFLNADLELSRAVASVRRFSTTVAVACTNSASWRASSLKRAGRADDRELGTGDGGGLGGGALLTGDRAFDDAGERDTAAGDGLEAFWDRGGVLAGDRRFVDAWPFAGFFAAASAATAASRSATAASRSDKAASLLPSASASAAASSPSVWPMPPSW